MKKKAEIHSPAIIRDVSLLGQRLPGDLPIQVREKIVSTCESLRQKSYREYGSRLVTTFSCYLAITGDAISDNLPHHKNSVVWLRLIGALNSATFVELPAQTRYLYTRVAIEVARELWPEEGVFHNITISSLAPTPSIKALVKKFEAIKLNDEQVLLWRGWPLEDAGGHIRWLPLHSVAIRHGMPFASKLYEIIANYWSGSITVLHTQNLTVEVAQMPAAEPAMFQHDQPQVTNDLYSRKPFAEQLGRLLVLPPKSPGVVIGVEGPWGSGKTTVVRYIVESLKTASDEAPIVVEFNPWMLAGADALVEALLTELASGIGMNAGKKRAKKSLDAAGKILGYAGLLRHLKYLKYVPGVSLVGVAADTVGSALHEAGKLANKAGEAVDNAKKVVEEAEKLVSVKAGLSERKKEVIKALAKLDRSIVVIVDDLDRLTPDEIKAVFRTIKAVADFPRIAYLLAYDRNVVSESLGGGPVAGGNAYIEKIVQVAYPISPAFPWQLQSHISEEIANLLKRINRELVPFESELLARATTLTSSLCRYPRDIVRLMNRLTLSLTSTGHEVNAADVIVAEALFQRFPSIRDAVVQNPEQFTGFFWSVAEETRATDWSMYFSSTKEERRTAWQAHLPPDEADKAVAAGVLKFLFPITNGTGSNSPPRSHLRMSELSRLIRFFTLTSVTGVQEVADIHEMLAKPGQVGGILNDLDYASATELVSHMTAYIDTAKSVDCAGVVRELIRSCTKEEFHASSTRDFSRAVAILAANCLQRSGAHTSVIANEFVDSISLTYGLDFLVTVGMRHKEIRGVDEYKVANAPLYIDDPQIVSSCIESWRKRADTAIVSGSLVGNDDLFAVLYGLSNIGHSCRNTDAISAFRTFCVQAAGGLAHFLDRARPFKELQPELFFLYVWDVDAMATLVEQSTFADEFTWYVNRLRTDPNARRFVEDRNNA